MDNLIEAPSTRAAIEKPVVILKRSERRLAMVGGILFWAMVTCFVAMPTLLGLLAITKYFGALPQTIVPEHRLTGALPSDFPRPLVREDTSAYGGGLDFTEFRSCRLSNPAQMQEIRDWLATHGAKSLSKSEIHGPAWFCQSWAEAGIEWKRVLFDTGRVTPDGITVGMDEQRALLFLIISKP